MNSGGGMDARQFIGKLYSFKIWDNGVIVRDYIPVYSRENKQFGLYDKVNDKFYGSNGICDFKIDSNDYITSDKEVEIEGNHTLIATWAKPSIMKIYADNSDEDFHSTTVANQIKNIEFEVNS